jgi:hypothetical protein
MDPARPGPRACLAGRYAFEVREAIGATRNLEEPIHQPARIRAVFPTR